MSDVAVKPEEKPVAVEPVQSEETASAPADTAPAAAAAAAVATEVSDTPAETKAEEPKKEEESKEEKPEPKAITHGTLSKTHGGLLSFFKQKRFFYFQDEPITEDNLKTYLRRDNASKPIAAFASQTGKGLWFYAKDEGHKEAPHGIIKLADVADVTSSGANKFVLKLASGDLHFEAPAAERDSWVFTLKTKVAEAKDADEAITSSEGYIAVLEKLSAKPTPAAAAKPAEKPVEAKDKETEEAKPEDAAEKPEVPETAVVSDEEAAGPSESKDIKRSTSKKAKRGSVFASFLNKKEKAAAEDKKEEKKEDKPEEVKEDDKPAEAAETPAPVAATEETPVTAAVEQPAAATTETKVEEEAKPAEESKPAETKPEPVTTPGTKRRSIFGGFFKHDAAAEEKKEEKKEKEAVEPVSKDAPIIETPEVDAKPIDAAAGPAEEPAADKAVPSSPPKSSKFLSNIFDKRDKSPSRKVEKTEDKTEAAEPKVEVPEAAVAETPSDAVVSPTEETPADPNAAVSPKEKRKSSFFSFKKEKKHEDVKSDSEDAEPAAHKPSTSPVPKGILGGLMRKASRAGKGKETETKEVSTPAAVAEEEADKTLPAPETTEPAKTEAEAEKKDETNTEAAPAIGDVVGDAVTVGQNPPVKAAA